MKFQYKYDPHASLGKGVGEEPMGAWNEILMLRKEGRGRAPGPFILNIIRMKFSTPKEAWGRGLRKGPWEFHSE